MRKENTDMKKYYESPVAGIMVLPEEEILTDILSASETSGGSTVKWADFIIN